MKTEIEQAVDDLLEPVELSAVQWKVLEALRSVLPGEGLHAQEVPEIVSHLTLDSATRILLTLRELDFVTQLGQEKKWYLTARGSAYCCKWSQAGVQEQEEPDFDQVDFGTEMLPTDFEPDIEKWKERADANIAILTSRGGSEVIERLRKLFGDEVRSVESTPDVTFYGLRGDVVGMYDLARGLLYIYKYQFPEVG